MIVVKGWSNGGSIKRGDNSQSMRALCYKYVNLVSGYWGMVFSASMNELLSKVLLYFVPGSLGEVSPYILSDARYREFLAVASP